MHETGYTIGKDFLSTIDTEKLEERNQTLREPQVYASLQAALGEDLYKQFAQRRPLDMSDGIPSRAQEFAARYDTIIEALPDEAGFAKDFCMTSRLEAGLKRSYLFFDGTLYVDEGQLAERLDIQDTLPQGEHLAYYFVEMLLVENAPGAVLNLLDYIPRTPENTNKQKALLLLNNPRHTPFTALVPDGKVLLAPITTPERVESILHEAGHIHAYFMNPGRTLYSPERDAMAFAFRALRNLTDQRFIMPFTRDLLVQHARKNIATYPTDFATLKEQFYKWDILGDKSKLPNE